MDGHLVTDNRAFGLLWLSEAGVTVGSGLQAVALPWLVLAVTGSPLGLGLAFALRSAPDVLVAPVVGHLLDTRPRRPLLIAGQALSGVAVAALGALSLAGRLGPVHLYGTLVALSVLGSVSHNARRSALPVVVADRRLDDANAWLDATRSALSLGFLLAGGVLTAFVGAATTLVAAGVVPVVGAAALLALSRPLHEDRESGPSPRFLTGTVAGLRAAFGSPRVRALLAVGVAINLFVVPLPQVVLPTVGRQVFGSALAFTLLLAGFRGGDLAGNALVGRVDWGRWRTLAAGVLAVGATATAAGVAGHLLDPAPGADVALAVLVALFVLVGVGQPLYNVPSSSLLQTAAPDERRGRVVTTTNSVLQASFPVPLVAAGALLSTWSAFALLSAAGLGMVALGSAVALWARGRDAD